MGKYATGILCKKEYSTKSGVTVRIAYKNSRQSDLEKSGVITPGDSEMDTRAKAAVKAAVERAVTCHKPIAKYDIATQRAYLEYNDGTREVIK